MRRATGAVTAMLLVCGALWAAYAYRPHLPASVTAPLGLREGITEIRSFQTPRLETAMAEAGLTFGAPIYLRIFKEEAALEIWSETATGYRLFRTYPICNYSGSLGPKLKEGDRQSPEGLYRVGSDQLNPNSSYHLSFNLGFPNAFDRAAGRTGSFLMVHGNCLSVGCYAMTDPLIEEIYVLVEAALSNGQAFVPVHAFPFRMTPARMQRAEMEAEGWIYDFWQQLLPAYRLFEHSRRPPDWRVVDRRYVLEQ